MYVPIQVAIEGGIISSSSIARDAKAKTTGSSAPHFDIQS